LTSREDLLCLKEKQRRRGDKEININGRHIKRTLLVNPPTGEYRRDERCQSKISEQTARVILPPMDLMYMAACLERAGVDCRIIDYPAIHRDWTSYRKDLKEIRPDLLIVSTTTPTMERDLEAAGVAKDIIPEATVILKGGYFFKFDKEPFGKIDSVDMVIRHEHEFVALDMANEKPLGSIGGITYRNGNEIIRNPDRDFSDEMDLLPPPARHLVDNSLYTSPENGRPLGVIHTGKGCSSRCIFCPAGPISGRKVRLRSPENVVAELRVCVKDFGLKQFIFNADTFTYSKDFVIECCKGIINEGMKIRWGCNSKVNTIDKEMLEWMKRAGCWIVGFGIETGSQEILNKMKKGTTLDQATKAISLCKEVGMKTHTFYIIGLPWETRETIKETEKFARSLNADFFDFNISYPLPGTEYWEIAEDNNLFEDVKTIHESYANSPIRSFNLTHEELIKLRRQLLLRLYLRPGYILRTLAGQVSEPSVLFHYCYNAIRRLSSLLVQ